MTDKNDLCETKETTFQEISVEKKIAEKMQLDIKIFLKANFRNTKFPVEFYIKY